MKRFFTKKLLTIALATMLVTQFIPYARASYINPHAYAQQRFSVSNIGGSFFSPAGESQLLSNYSPTYPKSFITNEMWVHLGSSTSGQWLEIGCMKGNLNGNYYAGRFAAVYNSSGYTEYSLGSSGSGVLFKLEHIGSGVWGAYVGSAKVLDIQGGYTSSTNMTVGVESSDSANIFSSGMTNTSMQYKSTSGTWTNWTTPYNLDSNTLGWTTSYNQSTNTITYNR